MELYHFLMKIITATSLKLFEVEKCQNLGLVWKNIILSLVTS